MDAQMPRARAAHRKTTQCDFSSVDGIVSSDMLPRLKDVHLAREFERVAIATVRMKDKRIRRRELAE